jgi:hypothetical protein
MVYSAAACAWGGCRADAGRGKQEEDKTGCLSFSDDPDPAPIRRRIHVRGVGESII